MAFWDTFKDILSGANEVRKAISPSGIRNKLIGEAAQLGGKIVSEVADVAAPVAKAVGGAAANFLGQGFVGPLKTSAGNIGAARVSAQLERQTGAKLNETLRDGLSEYAREATARGVDEGAKAAFDPILEVAAKLETEVFSPYVKRPIAAAALATDPESPLYKDDAYGKGFQISDVLTAYDRSKDVSLGVALTKSLLNPFHISGISDAILESGDIDIDRVNLWNDRDVEANFSDNTTGRWMTGFTDFLVGEAAVYAATAGSLSAVKAAARAAGLSNKLNVYDVDAIKKLEKLADDHLSGTTETVFGSDLVNMAASDNVVYISKILKDHTNNPRLADLVLETKDPAFVRDLILADKGYAPAINRLMNSQKTDDLWYISNAAEEVSADFAKTGKYRSYNAEFKERWNKAFEDAVKKNPETEKIFNAFLSDRLDPATGKIVPEPRVLGTTFVPMEPVIGRQAAIALRGARKKLSAAAAVRDFSNVGGVAQTIIGSGRRGGAATALIHFTGGKLPRGIISHSGLRPSDSIEELNAWLDDIDLFADGRNLIKLRDGSSISASEYRRNLITKVVALDTDAKRAAFFQEMNNEVAMDVLATLGVGRVQARNFINEVNESIQKYHFDLSRDSFAMDPSGVRVVVSPQTQRQLANATPLIPMGKIVREASKITGAFNPTNNVFTSVGRSVFEAGNKVFSFAQLVRPAYIPKNSIFEPMNAAFMSLGAKFLADSTKSFVRSTIANNRARFNALVNKADIKGVARRKAIKEEYGQYLDQYGEAVDIVDNATAEWVEFFVNPDARSPVTKAQYAEIVKEDLRAAERLIARLEEKMRKRAREFGFEREEIPSLYGLTRRVQYLKSLKDPKIASEIRAAELAITKAAGDINTLAPDLNVLSGNLKKAYDAIDELLVKMGPARKKLADEWSVVDDARIRISGRQGADGYVVSNGQVVPIPRFESENHLGTAYKAEIANRHTREMEILGNKAFATRTQILGRRSSNRITDVTDPRYFDELAYTVNNFMRGDILVDQILMGRSRDEIIQNWGLTRSGRAYADEFGRDRSEIIDIIDDQIAYINRYLPTLEAKAYAAAGDVRANRLAQLLGDKLEQLTPINPLDNKYATKVADAANFFDAFNRATSKAWSVLGAPENLIRNAWGNVELRNRTIEKIELLASQGYDIDVTTVSSVRQAAAIEMVKEAEKTFYSIRRQNRALYAARSVLAFPAAAASGIYRYTRFAAKSPARMAGFLNAYYGLYNSFGVDQYGNPVDDPLKATHLIVPGTKELGLKNGQGIMVGSRATAFLANFAGPAYAVPFALGAILDLKPGNDKLIKEAIDTTFGRLPGYSYEELFPYGIETDLKKAATQTFTPGWLRSFLTYATGDDANRDFVDSYTSEWNYQMQLYEMGLGKKPTEKSVEKETKKKFREKFLWQLASPLGTPAVVDTRPDNIFTTYFRAAADKYKAQGMSDREAKIAAENDLNTRLKPLAPTRPFQKERLYYGAKRRPKATYAVPTVEGYQRIWEDFDYLANKLSLVNKNLVGLLTSDLQGAKSDPNIARILNRPGTTLPDGTVLNLPLKSIADVEKDIEVSRAWAKYSDYKRVLNEAARKKGYASYASVPEAREALQAYAAQIGEISPNWLVEYNKNKTEDVSYQYALGLSMIVNDDKFMAKHGNTQYWTHVAAILRYRQDFVNLYKDAPAGYKSVVLNSWRDYINGIVDTVDPKLSNIIDRYFENDNLKEVKLD